MIEKSTLSVLELTRRIKLLLESQIGEIWVEGEISNFRAQSSGHLYFTLKDASAQIAAVMFRGAASKMACRPQDGMKVRLSGEISVYEVRGQYQIIVHRMEESGLGELQAKFEELKRKLQEEGLFDQGRKRAIPKFPTTIGLITSPTGAVLQDFLNITRRRFPAQAIIVSPVKVQGQGAAQEVADAIAQFNLLNQVDVIVIARGGGSLEDLWAFNEELLARAVAASVIPTVSAVGHEIDFTICDFCADLRAPTPSAAAELVVPHQQELLNHIGHLRGRLGKGIQSALNLYRLRVERLTRHDVFLQPSRLTGLYQQQVDGHLMSLRDGVEDFLAGKLDGVRDLRGRLAQRSPAAQIARYRQRLALASSLLPRHSRSKWLTNRSRLDTLMEKLKLLSPLNALSRGYALVKTPDGKLLRSIKKIAPGQKVRTQLSDGEFDSVVGLRSSMETDVHDDGH